MSFGSRKARQEVKFTFNSENINTYYSLKDLQEVKKPQIIRKLWINTKSRFGDTPMLTTDTYHVNLPTFMLDEVKKMMDDEQDVKDINAGLAAFRVIRKTGKKGNQYLAVEWCDPDPDELPF